MASLVAPSPQSTVSRKRGFCADISPIAAPTTKRTRFDGYARLRGLFPMVDDQTIRTVFDACKGDIDSAVARLSALALASTAARTAPPSPPSPPRAPEPEPAATIETARSPDDWVGAFVAEMARSSDIPDARARAARALRAFEQFVSARSARQADQRADRLERENLVLKRAVAVQARRLEATDGEKAALERTVSAQAERLRRAERTNYALSVHLHRASPGGMPDNRPPDVY
jgi:hypothetical protein